MSPVFHLSFINLVTQLLISGFPLHLVSPVSFFHIMISSLYIAWPCLWCVEGLNQYCLSLPTLLGLRSYSLPVEWEFHTNTGSSYCGKGLTIMFLVHPLYNFPDTL